MDFDFEYLWEELEISLNTQEMKDLMNYLNLNKIEEAKKILVSVLEQEEDINFLISEYMKIKERTFDLIPYSKEEVIKDLLNEEINVYVANVFGNIEKVVFLNFGNQEIPKIKFFVENNLLEMEEAKQIWKAKYN